MVSGEGLLRAILAAIDEGIHVVDTRGVTIYYNDVAARTDGLRPEEVLGRPLLDVFPSLTPATSTLLVGLKQRAPMLSRQQTFTNFKGHRVTTVNSTYPIWVDGQLVGALEVSKDITRVRELAESVLDLRAALIKRNRRAGSEAEYSFADLTGENPRFRLVVEQARRAAEGQSAVLVAGETGTGKELLVQAIHNGSPRARGPFVAQNCAALPQGLLEGILFGTVRGGFTGAEDRAGLFELADGGSLFLDEINSMPLELQAKLLRVLQNGRVRRVGDTRERQVDVRILAAAGGDPLAAVAAGQLRQDLFYRINVVFLELPPLRERQEDIPLLTEHFLRRYGGSSPPVLSTPVRALFQAYPWPGNVRELEHAIEGALQVSRGTEVQVADLPPNMRARAGGRWWGPDTGSLTQPGGGAAAVARPASGATAAPEAGAAPRPEPASPGSGHQPLRERLQHAEREYLEQALQAAGGNVAAAARALAVPRQTLQYRLRRAGLPTSPQQREKGMQP